MTKGQIVADAMVLIIEDRKDIATKLEQAVLDTAGLGLLGIAHTLDHGLNLLFDRQPRLVLVDIGLPDGTGIDVVRACRQANWQVDAVIVAIVGDEARVIEAIKAGAKGYLLKGAGLQQIGEDILSVLEGGSPISPAIARHLLKIVALEQSHDAAEPSPLTARETEILRAVARGYKRSEIAQQLGISAGTVGNHITSIYRKLEVTSNTEAIAHASRMGVL